MDNLKEKCEIPDFEPYSLSNIVHSLLGYVGIIAKRMTWARAFFFGSNLLLSYFLFQCKSKYIAVAYAIFANFSYFAYLTIVFKENGFRDYLCRKYDDEKAYRIYEGILAFIFYHPANALIYFNICFADNVFAPFFDASIQNLLYLGLFSFGLVVKLWSAVMVGVDIYYCRDMFMRKSIIPFQTKGIYRFFKNPMYSVGHAHAYSIPLKYGNFWGFLIALLNQLLVYVFYYSLEKKFVKSFYGSKES